MLAQLNVIAQNYEYLIKAIGALIPILLTIFMIYIAYQQWIISKRASNIEMSKESKENFYKPFRKYLSRIIYSLFISDKNATTKNNTTTYLNGIKNLSRKYPYFVKEYNDELIKYSFNLFCRLTYKQKRDIIIKKSWKLYKKWFQWIVNVYVPEEIKINIYPSRFPNIYSIISYMIKITYKFITPYFIQDVISKIYVKAGMFLWSQAIMIHILIHTAINFIKNSIKEIKNEVNTKAINNKENIVNEVENAK